MKKKNDAFTQAYGYCEESLDARKARDDTEAQAKGVEEQVEAVENRVELGLSLFSCAIVQTSSSLATEVIGRGISQGFDHGLRGDHEMSKITPMGSRSMRRSKIFWTKKIQKRSRLVCLFYTLN